MDHSELDDDSRMSGDDSRINDMEDDTAETSGGGGRDSPLRHPPMTDQSEDILSKLRQQVSMAHRLDGSSTSPPSSSPNLHLGMPFLNGNAQNEIYNRLQNILQAKMKREEDEHNNMMDESNFAALHRQRENLMPSPTAILAAAGVRGAVPPSLVHPGAHMGLLPGAVGLPPSTQHPPTPGSAGSRDSSGNGSRTPSHTPEPAQQNWNFDEPFKQNQEPSKHSSFEEDKRKLYELSDDPKRREFLDDLFTFMQNRGTPVNRLPIMAKQVLDLYELYNLVVSRGGLVDVINKKLWQEIIKGLKLPSSITSAAFTLRTQYMKYIYPYECEKNKLSNPQELQIAIDGNRREGRRSSYAGGYADLNQPSLMGFHGFPTRMHHQPMSLVSRPQMNGGGMPGHPLVPQDLLRAGLYPGGGGGGSPPSGAQAVVDAATTRLNLWKLYNQQLAAGPGVMGNSIGAAGMPMPAHEEDTRNHHPHMPILPPHPPQREALNLDVKDEFDIGPRSNKKESPTSADDESNGLPPAAKRLHEDDHMNSRDVPPASSSGSSSSTSSGPNIEINALGAHGDSGRNGSSQSNGQSLSINMEINGIQYKGVLWPQAPPTSPNRHNNTHHSNPLMNNNILPQLSSASILSSPASPVGLSGSRFR